MDRQSYDSRKVPGRGVLVLPVWIAGFVDLDHFLGGQEGQFSLAVLQVVSTEKVGKAWVH